MTAKGENSAVKMMMLKSFLNNNTLLSTGLLVLLAFSLWLTQQSFFQLDDTGVSRPTTPDTFMTNMHYVSFDKNGEWNSKLQVTRMTHYPDKDTSILEKPQYISRTKDQLTWVISADHGTAQEGLKKINLKDHVLVDRIHAINGNTLSLRTTEMVAFPKENFAQTDKPVTIIQPGSTVNAVGLTVNMNSGDIHLLSGVEGNYVGEKK